MSEHMYMWDVCRADWYSLGSLTTPSSKQNLWLHVFMALGTVVDVNNIPDKYIKLTEDEVAVQLALGTIPSEYSKYNSTGAWVARMTVDPRRVEIWVEK